MRNLDRHYTPPSLAASVISACQNFNPRQTADFSVGEGALLEAVVSRWPSCGLNACDIDPDAVHHVKRRYKGINADVCDFLDGANHEQSKFLRPLRRKMSLVYLNPPFSSRMGDVHHLNYGTQRIKCSRAMAFVAMGTNYLSNKGQLIALVPSSALTSERDKNVRSLLFSRCEISEIEISDSSRFKGCQVDVRAIRLRFGATSNEPLDVASTETLHSTQHVELTRGRLFDGIAFDRCGDGAVPFIHTTNMRSGRIVKSGRYVLPAKLRLYKSAILLPRVGRPSRDKLCLRTERNPIVISDCVLAITCESNDVLQNVFETMHRQWSDIEGAYVGSCAKYLTLGGLSAVLKKLGIQASVEPLRSWHANVAAS